MVEHVVDRSVTPSFPVPWVDHTRIGGRVVVPCEHVQDGARRQQRSRIVLVHIHSDPVVVVVGTVEHLPSIVRIQGLDAHSLSAGMEVRFKGHEHCGTGDSKEAIAHYIAVTSRDVQFQLCLLYTSPSPRD